MDERLAGLRAERALIAAEQDDAPPASDQRPAGREGRPGAPLWQIVRFVDTVDDTHAAAIEGALYGAGLLTAWVHPEPALTGAALAAAEADGYLVAVAPAAPVAPAPGGRSPTSWWPRTLAASHRRSSAACCGASRSPTSSPGPAHPARRAAGPCRWSALRRSSATASTSARTRRQPPSTSAQRTVPAAAAPGSRPATRSSSRPWPSGNAWPQNGTRPPNCWQTCSRLGGSCLMLGPLPAQRRPSAAMQRCSPVRGRTPPAPGRRWTRRSPRRTRRPGSCDRLRPSAGCPPPPRRWTRSPGQQRSSRTQPPLCTPSASGWRRPRKTSPHKQK